MKIAISGLLSAFTLLTLLSCTSNSPIPRRSTTITVTETASVAAPSATAQTPSSIAPYPTDIAGKRLYFVKLIQADLAGMTSPDGTVHLPIFPQVASDALAALRYPPKEGTGNAPYTQQDLYIEAIADLYAITVAANDGDIAGVQTLFQQAIQDARQWKPNQW
jgi:hypothetical protein